MVLISSFIQSGYCSTLAGFLKDGSKHGDPLRGWSNSMQMSYSKPFFPAIWKQTCMGLLLCDGSPDHFDAPASVEHFLLSVLPLSTRSAYKALRVLFMAFVC